MNKSNRLNSILEDFENTQILHKDKDYQLANFRDYIKTNDYKAKLKRKQIVKKPLIDDKDLNYLTTDATLINSRKKFDELEQILQAKREPIQSTVKTRFNLGLNRNPNIQNLLLDIRAKSGVNQLQEELKNEFDLFLNASFNYTLFPKKPEWNYLTLGDLSDEDTFKRPSLEKEFTNLNNNNEVAIVELPAIKTPTLNIVSKGSIKPIHHKQSNEIALITNPIKKSEIFSNMQVALVDSKIKKSKPIVELNKMLESIKR